MRFQEWEALRQDLATLADTPRAEGEYRIEPLAPEGSGRVRLRLESRHRLSTRFNPYAGLWTDFILGDTQRYILEALKERCEG